MTRLLCAFLLILSSTAALTAEPLTIIWPAPPGGGGDIYLRILGKVIARDFGVPVVNANISGGGGAIGVSRMIAAKPDGTTLAGAWTGPISIAPHTLGVPYQPGDYIPVIHFSSAPYVLCTAPDFPAANGVELLDVLKKNPNKYTYGTDGPGGLGQLAATRIFMHFGITQRDVPFKGAGESTVALAGRHVDMYSGTIPPIQKFLASGTVKCLLVTAAKRAAALPQVTSLGDIGIPQEESLLWRAVFAPKGTPPQIIQNLEKMLEAAARSPESLKFLEESGEVLEIYKGAELAERLRREYESMAKVVKAAGMEKK
jgi:tripartite-type tricarboxylate transporter receptor subunit TctC